MRLAGGMTSVPTPSPAITAIVKVFIGSNSIVTGSMIAVLRYGGTRVARCREPGEDALSALVQEAAPEIERLSTGGQCEPLGLKPGGHHDVGFGGREEESPDTPKQDPGFADRQVRAK